MSLSFFSLYTVATYILYLFQHIYYLFYNIYIGNFLFHSLKLHYRENKTNYDTVHIHRSLYAFILLQLLQHIYYIIQYYWVAIFLFHSLKLHYRENCICIYTLATLTTYILYLHIYNIYSNWIFTLWNFIIERIGLTQIPLTKPRYRWQKIYILYAIVQPIVSFFNFIIERIYYMFYF